MVDKVIEQEIELEQLKARSDALATELKDSRVERYIPMITAKGKLKGELAHLTPKQFEKYTGTKPRQSIIIDGKIPWHLALDTIATESGYKSDEEFRDAVLRAKDTKDELEKVSADIRLKKQGIKETKTTPAKIEHIKMEGEPPVFPKEGSSTEVVTEVDGVTLKRRRNPSFWQVEADRDGDNKPDTVVRVRYSKDAQKMVNVAARGHQEDITKGRRITRRLPQITPKRPRLRR